MSFLITFPTAFNQGRLAVHNIAEIWITSPDGFVPQNLVALDDQPGVDLNASLHGAVLPLSGLYVLYAATSRGFGDYRLSFTITSMATPAEGERIVILPPFE
jgi:hypothetical protein